MVTRNAWVFTFFAREAKRSKRVITHSCGICGVVVAADSLERHARWHIVYDDPSQEEDLSPRLFIRSTEEWWERLYFVRSADGRIVKEERAR